MLRGFIDRLRAGILEGWALDERNPDRPIDLAVCNRSDIVGIGRANIFRADLLAHGIGTGFHGFRIPIGDVAPMELCIRALGQPTPIAWLDTTTEPVWTLDDLTRHLVGREQWAQAKLETETLDTHGIAGDLQRRASRGHVVVLSPIPWVYRKQRPQHLAESLSEFGFTVSFVNPVLVRNDSPQLVASAATSAVRIYDLGVRTTQHKVGQATMPPKLADEVASAIQHAFDEPPILLVQHPWWTSAVKKIKKSCRKIVYDCIDLHSEMPANDASIKEEEVDLISFADAITTTSPALRNLIQHRHGRRALLIANATTSQLFTVEARPRKGPIVAGYIGAIEDWLDYDFLLGFVENRSVRLTIAGDYARMPDSVKSALLQSKKCKLLGEIPYTDVPQILSSFDVGLVPFRDDHLARCVDAVKVYEYLASGRPVVATVPCFDEALGENARIISDGRVAADWVQQNETWIRSKGTRSSCRQSVFQHTWEHRAATMLNVLLHD